LLQGHRTRITICFCYSEQISTLSTPFPVTWHIVVLHSIILLILISVCFDEREEDAVATTNLHMALWLYAGPSVTLRACPTWDCVRPRDSLRSLKTLANSLISSKLIPSTTLLVASLIVGWSVIKIHSILYFNSSILHLLFFNLVYSHHDQIIKV